MTTSHFMSLEELIREQTDLVAVLLEKLDANSRGMAVMQQEREKLVADWIFAKGRLEGLQEGMLYQPILEGIPQPRTGPLGPDEAVNNTQQKIIGPPRKRIPQE